MAGPVQTEVVAAERAGLPGMLPRTSLLAATVIGTMSNNVINVPLRDIATDFGQPVQRAVLAVLAFSLFLAVAMPLTGWLGDRLGRRRVLAIAVALMAAGQLAAAAAPNLETLVVVRGLQGLGCSGIPPLVMGLLVWMHPQQPVRMMAAWAAANGVGQAAGPPIGGVIADLLGWRAIFLVMAAASVVVLVVIVRAVPAPPRREAVLHLPGALLLTVGAALLLAGFGAVSQASVPRIVPVALGVAGLLTLSAFVGVSRGNPHALIPLRLVIETRFARSTAAAFAQMFALGTALVAIPLLLTGEGGLSPSQAGTVFFALPLTMALLATLVGRVAERWGPRPVLRSGLVVVALSAASVAALAAKGTTDLRLILPVLVGLGLGMAFVQTPAASGATRSPAGHYGSALGLFSLVRFSGSTIGAAWVALLVPGNHMGTIFLGTAVIALGALALSFAGPNPQQLHGQQA